VKFDQYSSPWQIIPINPIELPKGTNGTVHRFSISSKVFDYGQEKWQKLKPVERELFSEKYLDHVTNSSWRYLAGSTQYELAVALHNALLDSVGIVAPPPKSKLPKERWVFDLYNNIEGPFDSEEAAREAQKTYRKNLPPKLAPGAMSEPYLMDAHKKVIEKLTEGEANSYVNEIKEYLKKKYPGMRFGQSVSFSFENGNASQSFHLSHDQAGPLNTARYKKISRQTSFEKYIDKSFYITKKIFIKRVDSRFPDKSSVYYFLLPSMLIGELQSRYELFKYKMKEMDSG
jgi:hypothetical protein